MREGLFKTGVVALCLGAFTLLTGCEDFDLHGMSDRYREDFHFSYPMNANGKIDLEGFNGGVEIVGWDKELVEIDGTKYASSEERMKQIKVDITPEANSITIRTGRPSDRFGNAGVKYSLHVPKHAELSNIVSSNGPMRVEGIEGRARLKTSNGSIRAVGIHGNLDATTSNGTVDLSDVVGDTTVHTSNGSVKADIKKGTFEARTSNGSITARLLETDSKPVRLESSNGHIEVTMDAAREVHADTSNSSITVRMPGSIGAQVRAHTSNASISSEFDVNVRGGTMTKHRMEGQIGSGGPLLDLGTSNGGIKLVRF